MPTISPDGWPAPLAGHEPPYALTLELTRPPKRKPTRKRARAARTFQVWAEGVELPPHLAKLVSGPLLRLTEHQPPDHVVEFWGCPLPPTDPPRMAVSLQELHRHSTDGITWRRATPGARHPGPWEPLPDGMWQRGDQRCLRWTVVQIWVYRRETPGYVGREWYSANDTRLRVEWPGPPPLSNQEVQQERQRIWDLLNVLDGLKSETRGPQPYWDPDRPDIFRQDLRGALRQLLTDDNNTRATYTNVAKKLGPHRTTIQEYCEDVFHLDLRAEAAAVREELWRAQN